MGLASVALGIISLACLVAAFLPELVFLRWAAMILSLAGMFLGLNELVGRRGRLLAVTGTVLCSLALIASAIIIGAATTNL